MKSHTTFFKTCLNAPFTRKGRGMRWVGGEEQGTRRGSRAREGTRSPRVIITTRRRRLHGLSKQAEYGQHGLRGCHGVRSRCWQPGLRGAHHACHQLEPQRLLLQAA